MVDVPTKEEFNELVEWVGRLTGKVQDLETKVKEPIKLSRPLQGSSARRHIGESQAEAFDRVDGLIGPLQVLRIFDGAKGWDEVDRITRTLSNDVALIVSSKDIRLSKIQHDNITNGGTRKVWFCYHHEPENDNITPEAWREGQKNFANIVRAWGGTSCSILMGHTWNPNSGRNPEEWFVDDIDVYGVDAYYRMGENGYPGQVENFAEWCRTKGKRWLIGEWGINSNHAVGLERAEGIRSYGSWINAQNDCVAACWWHAKTSSGGSYEVDDDAASREALKTVIAGGTQ